MTGPRLKRRNYGRGHGYTIDGQKVSGVTTVLNTLPKDALVGWAANTTAAAAVDRWDELGQLAPSQRIKELEDARFKVNKEATTRGTKIHDLGEKLSHGEEVEVPDALLGPVQAYARFLDRWDVTVIATEAPCGHTGAKYAGTLDAVATIGRLGDEPVMLDLKTGRGVYEATALQLAAYVECDLWQPDGPDSEQPMPELGNTMYVAHILADDVLLLPVENDPALFKQFRYLQMTARWLANAKEMSPIGAPLQLDEVGQPGTTDLDRLHALIDNLTDRRDRLIAAQTGATA